MSNNNDTSNIKGTFRNDRPQEKIHVEGLGDVYDLGAWGFPYQKAEDNIIAPASAMGIRLHPDLKTKGYHVQELNDGFYWVTNGGYDSAFVVSSEGVIAIDAPPNLGANLLKAVKEVTDKPVTHVIYSHWHSDHIGAADVFGPDVEIIAHEITKELLERFPDPQRPIPTRTFTDELTLDIAGVRLELAYKGANHTPGNIFIHAPEHRVLTKIDILSPGQSPFFHADASENISGWLEAHDQILEYDFDYLITGHLTRYGTREDVEAAREYFNDMLDLAWEAVKVTKPYSIYMESGGWEYSWVGSENWLNVMANYVTGKVLNKVSSNGETWADRLAGATSMTKYHAHTIVESVRLERTHHGYAGKNPEAPFDFIV